MGYTKAQQRAIHAGHLHPRKSKFDKFVLKEMAKNNPVTKRPYGLKSAIRIAGSINSKYVKRYHIGPRK